MKLFLILALLLVLPIAYSEIVKATFVRSDFGGLDQPYHAYYADPDAGYVRYYIQHEKYDNSYLAEISKSMPAKLAQSQNYILYVKSKSQVPTALKKVQTVYLTNIPRNIYNKPDEFYYNPKERTTLDRPYYYYKLKRTTKVDQDE